MSDGPHRDALKLLGRDCRSRREVLKLLGLGAASLPLWQVLGCGKTSRARRPNIVFILTDDHRHDAMSCAGHPWIRTPNLDRLAAEGVRFVNTFVTTSLCSPSRASFLTGCYAHTHGVVANEQNDPDPTLPTFPQLLHGAGYETAFVGKWHMARTATPRPGFDHWVSFNGQGDYFRNTFNVDGNWEIRHDYVTDALTSYALRFLQRDHDRPFLLWLSHKAVHAPFAPAPRHESLYADVPISSQDDPADQLGKKPDWGGRQRAFPDWNLYLRNYARCLAAVDESLEKILGSLTAQGLLDDTVVIYASDNGFMHGEHGGLWDKRAAYEPSIRIPLLMRYPALARPGTLCSEMVLNLDLAATLLQLGGIAAPSSLQGQSWLPLLRGARGRDDFLYEYFAEEPPVPTILAVRTRDWKYVTYPERNSPAESADFLPDELYDLQRDSKELDNLGADPARAGTVAELQQRLEDLQERTGFHFPSK